MADPSYYDTGGPHYSSIDISGNTQRFSEDTAFLAEMNVMMVGASRRLAHLMNLITNHLEQEKP